MIIKFDVASISKTKVQPNYSSEQSVLTMSKFTCSPIKSLQNNGHVRNHHCSVFSKYLENKKS